MLPTLLRRRREPASYTSPAEWMERYFRPWWPETFAEGELTGAYPVDIREEDSKLIVDAEMPGFKNNEIDVSIDNGVLNITAERKPEEHAGATHLSERRYTRVQRSFTLPTAVDESKVEAKLEEGVLHLELPETEESKPKQIQIK